MIHPPKAKASQASLAALLGTGMSRVIGEKSQSMHAKKKQLTLDTPTSHFRHILLGKACGKFKAKPLKTADLFFSSPIYRLLQKQNIQRVKSDTEKSVEDKSLIKTSSYGLNFIDG